MDIAGRYANLLRPHGPEVSYTEGCAFDSISLGARCTAVEHNSVLLLPGLLTAAECAALVADVERSNREGGGQSKGTADFYAEAAAAGQEQGGGEAEASAAPGDVAGADDAGIGLDAEEEENPGVKGFQRFMINELSDETLALFDELLRSRLLPFVEQHLPAVAEMVRRLLLLLLLLLLLPAVLLLLLLLPLRLTLLSFVQVWTRSQKDKEKPRFAGKLLGDLRFKYSAQEPAINRYTEGGLFKPHTDLLSLTLNVLLAARHPTPDSAAEEAEKVGGVEREQPEPTFRGGGTAFWAEDSAVCCCGYGVLCPLCDGAGELQGADAGEAEEEEGGSVAAGGHGPPTLVLDPTGAGDAVVFNGTVKHSGRVVTAGVRHLLVASFSIA